MTLPASCPTGVAPEIYHVLVRKRFPRVWNKQDKTIQPKFLAQFAQSESGAVTVDWVVLTAAIVGLGLATVGVVSAGMESLSNDIAGELNTIDAGTIPFGGVAAAASVDFSAYPNLFFPEGWWPPQFAGMEETELLAQYASQYTIANGSVNNRVATDILGVIETEMATRGLDRPQGNLTFDEVYTLNGGTVPT